jgi:alpha-D-ribose 1-methylphosphonate 5-triphosphate diphosphatase
MKQTIINNAKLILADEVIDGHVVIEDDLIKEVGSGACSLPSSIDVNGDYLMPGMIELHTDSMEKFFEPRPGVEWPGISAALAHDAQISAAGITTVFDSVSVGYDFVASRNKTLPTIVASISEAEKSGIHKSEHLLHLRCEVSSKHTYDEFLQYAENDLVRLASLMDHAPGQRQFASIAKYRQYYQGKYGFSDPEMDDFIELHKDRSNQNSTRNRDAIVEYCHANGIALASHDDAKHEHVEESMNYGVTIAEFPTTVEAAKLSHENNLQVLMGAPNLIRGMSHSGNVSAAVLAKDGYLDILSSDYFPNSLLHAAFKLANGELEYSLPKAIRCVSQNPAVSSGLDDRGVIEAGKLADILIVKKVKDLPILQQVWKRGMRVN